MKEQPEQSDKIYAGKSVKMCAHHKPHNLGYIAFLAYADEMNSKGIFQTQCPVCLYWFFPNEIGKSKS